MTRRAFLAAVAAAAVPSGGHGKAQKSHRKTQTNTEAPGAARPAAATTRLILLGTAGGPTPKRTRAAPSQVIVAGDRAYVVDCGNGVARQLVLAGIPLTSIRHVFITHHHSDHSADYGTLLLLAWGDALKTRVDTWGPPPLARVTSLFFEMSRPDLAIRERDEGRPPLQPLVHAHEITRGGSVFADDRVSVRCCLVDHPPLRVALAYRFDAPDRSIVISGDTRRSANLIALAKDADVLVHEALYAPRAPGAEGSALRHHILASHTPVEEAGRIAAEAGVKMLVLSHFVPGESPPVSDEEWLAAARTHYTGPIVVGHDLQEI